MLYKGLTFPKAKRPYFYSNFVATLDGKVQVLKDTEKYWPLGSKLDYETLIELRTYADVLIHGSGTALAHFALGSLSKPEFHKARKKTGFNRPILYIVVTNHPTDDLIPKLKSEHPLVKTVIITSKSAKVSKKLTEATEIVRLGKDRVDTKEIASFLNGRDLQQVLVEGGPKLMGTFFQVGLVDELFITIAPKVVGNEPEKTLTMVEGYLYPPSKVPEFKLISVIQEGNELYLRYRITKS